MIQIDLQTEQDEDSFLRPWYLYGNKDLVTKGINTFRANIGELFLDYFDKKDAEKNLEFFWFETEIESIETKEDFTFLFERYYCPLLGESKWFQGDKWDAEAYPCRREIINDLIIDQETFNEKKEIAKWYSQSHKDFNMSLLDEILKQILWDYYRFMGCLPNEKDYKKYGVVDDRLITWKDVKRRYNKI
jgi:hypothetical protein